MPIVPLFGRSFSSKSKTATAQLITNMYREPEGDPDKSSMTFYGTPGLSSFVTMSSGGGVADLPVRGSRTIGNYMWEVVGNSSGGSSVFYVSQGGVKTSVTVTTSMTTSSGRVGISDNGSQVIIVDGVYGYTCTIGPTGAATGNVTKIADVDFPNGATTVTFLNGYFICDNPNGTHVGQFNWSSQYDGTTWAALDFANAESNPDALQAVYANFGQLFLFGPLTTEIWAPSGDTAIFRRVGGAGVEWGLASKWTVDKYANNSLIFLGKNKLGTAQLVRMDGYTVTPLTDPDVTHDINQRNVSAATGYSYSLDAHTFYQLNFPDKSYLYDDLSQSYSVLTSGLTGGRHLGEVRAELNAVSYVSDYSSSNIYAVGSDTYTDNSNPIIRELVTRHVFNDLDYVTVWELIVDLETGVGLTSGQGSDPQIMLQISKDNGKTWGVERWMSMGAIGAYLTQVKWQQLGVGRDFVFKFRVSDPVKVVLTSAAMRIQ